MKDTGKILLADDSTYMRGILKKILRNEGYDEFVEAADGEAAVDAFTREHPDVVLLDVIMPHKNGLDALRDIRRLDADAPVVMVTAVGQDLVIEEARDAGANGFIVKPFRPEEVADAVRQALTGD